MVHQTFNENELISSTTSEDSYTPLSETVTTLASNVYKELERIIKNFGENSVKDLMPVMISTLGMFENPFPSFRQFFLCFQNPWIMHCMSAKWVNSRLTH